MFPPFAAKARRHAAGQLRKVPRKANRYFGLNTASLVTFKRRKKKLNIPTPRLCRTSRLRIVRQPRLHSLNLQAGGANS